MRDNACVRKYSCAPTVGARSLVCSAWNVQHFQPIIAHGFERRNPLAHTVHEYFPAAAWNRSESSGFEIGNSLLQRFVKDFPKVDKLAGTEPVNVHLGEAGFDVRKQIEVPLLCQFRMMPALHQNLCAAERNGLFDFLIDFIEGDDISVGVLLRAIKGAEFAVNVANIGIINVAIDNVGDYFVAAPGIGIGLCELPPSIRQRTQFLEWQRIELQRLGLIDA